MDKAIYKIRGNVFFKLGIYILVAVLAYGTLYTGGLVLQGSYLGVYSDDDQGATPYERLVMIMWRTQIMRLPKGECLHPGYKVAAGKHYNI